MSKVRVKPVAFAGCAAGGGLIPPAVAILLTAIARLATRCVSWLSWLASSSLVGRLHAIVSCVFCLVYVFDGDQRMKSCQ